MSNFNVQHWYKGAVAAAVALLGIGAVAKDATLIAIALGILFVGLGEWINHPFISRFIPSPGFGIPSGIASGEVRRPNVAGIVLDILGLAFVVVGVVRLGVILLAAPLN